MTTIYILVQSSHHNEQNQTVVIVDHPPSSSRCGSSDLPRNTERKEKKSNAFPTCTQSHAKTQNKKAQIIESEKENKKLPKLTTAMVRKRETILPPLRSSQSTSGTSFLTYFLEIRPSWHNSPCLVDESARVLRHYGEAGLHAGPLQQRVRQGVQVQGVHHLAVTSRGEPQVETTAVQIEAPWMLSHRRLDEGVRRQEASTSGPPDRNHRRRISRTSE